MIPLDVVSAPASGPWPGSGAVGLLLTLLSTGLLGMGLSDITSGITDRFSDDGDEDVGDLSGGDEFADGGGFGDDFMEGDGGGDDFDDFDDWDDEDDGDFDDLGGGDGGSASELEPRLNELENEVASVSSTMGTVRSENEAIQESVDDIEDNVRKLLEIYEMVTRGVNPFADEVEGSAGAGGSFGLFDGKDSGGDDTDDLDPDIAEADADSFFDDEWEDDVAGDEDFEDGEFDDVGVADQETESGSSDDEGGKTFDQLKSEYEDGDDGWSGDESGGSSDGGNGETVTEGPDPDGEDVESTETEDGAPVSRTSSEEGPGEDEAVGSTEESTSDQQTRDDEAADSGAGADDSDREPYLQRLPDGYGADLLVIEWLSYLRDSSDTAEALRAIRYYETIGWIGEPAAETLTQYLTGLKDGEGGSVPGGRTQLTVDHHTNSLRYIGRLSGADVQIERLEWTGASGRGARIEGGEQRGIQR